jgi:thiol-disulfide isomerase/thioredoxin
MSSRINIFSLVFGTAIAVALAPASRAQVKAGDTFPSLAAAALEGSTPPTAGKVVLVDFWASWCAPCHASFPAYARLQADYAPRGLVIVGVSVDDNDADYAKFVRKFVPPFATVRDGSQRLAAEVNIPGMPTSYLLDRSGKVRSVRVGFHTGETEAALRREIESLLAEK